ncbi:MAG: Crp/Fnr family transcriptional regulator [Firmicutes bacterium]|nr:Crp/Fnr family transcriptional regulator [Bacillota bacterium]
MAQDNAFLKRFPLFNDLDDDELERLSKIVFGRKYKKNQVIFAEGEPVDSVFLIREGRVKVAHILADGREQILHILRPDDIFPHVGLFGEGPFPATAEAIQDTTVALIRNMEFESFLLDNPPLCIKLLKVMSQKLRRLQGQVKDLAMRDTHGRMASVLFQLAKEHGIPSDEGIGIDLGLTRQELAGLIGTSRETVSRVLSDFRRDKAIIIKRQQIIIADEHRLRSWIQPKA